MNLQRKIRIGGWIILAALTLAIVVAAIGINQIRFGGPQHRAEQTMNALEADILPPPLFLVEPMLNATMAIDEKQHVEEYIADLAETRREYETRRDYWRKIALDDRVRAELEGADKVADAFWQKLDSE